MSNKIRVSHVIWGYLGGGVDSVLDSYLLADQTLPERIASHVIIVRPPGASSEKLPQVNVPVDIVSQGTRGIFRAARAVAKHIRGNRSDVVFLNGFNATILGFLLRPLLMDNMPIVSTYHGTYFAQSSLGRAKATVFNALERRFFKRHALAVIAVSKHSCECLKEMGIPAEKIIVLHNAITKGAPQVSCKAHTQGDGHHDPVRIITVSRLAPQKGIHILISAFAAVARGFPRVELVIVGGGPLEQELKQQVLDHGLVDRVQFFGNRSDIASLLTTADIFVMTSRQEDHSISILEAMRAGLPLVVTDVGGNSESVRNNLEGFLVPDLDVLSAQQAMSKLVSSPELRARMGTSARVRFEAHFELHVSLQKLSNILNEVVSSNRSRANG